MNKKKSPEVLAVENELYDMQNNLTKLKDLSSQLVQHVGNRKKEFTLIKEDSFYHSFHDLRMFIEGLPKTRKFEFRR